ncbi:hypothetical protein [Kribbella catacumbae]|uniref:hypothetical protein n=1 Tax=Kribbella catacumbae TaxID=460086 RepID=UPI000370A243|nr:hypothetical protein [Kribbella catacumbae]
MRDIALLLHVAAGAVGMLVGPLAIVLTLRARRLTWAGEVFHWAVAAVCLTALVMVPYDWGRLWVFWPISIASYLFVYLGQRAAEAPGGLWYRGVLRGYGGGWIALWTAILVVSVTEHPWTWAIPIVVGSAAIEVFCFRPSPTWTRS